MQEQVMFIFPLIVRLARRVVVVRHTAVADLLPHMFSSFAVIFSPSIQRHLYSNGQCRYTDNVQTALIDPQSFTEACRPLPRLVRATCGSNTPPLPGCLLL